MNIKILKSYINNCKKARVEPTFEGLREFNSNTKKLLVS